MRPDDSRKPAPVVPQRQILRPISDRPQDAASQAATSIVRDQINNIYEHSVASENDPQPHNPYQRTHSNHEEIQAKQWAKYHSAWQEYYQKYYERYYVGEVHRAKQELEEKVRGATATQDSAPQQPTAQTITEPEVTTREEALYDLRNSLREKVRASATSVRKSRHFIPISAASCVVLLFLFLQYNRVLFANVEAYVSPGSINPANIIIDPTTDVAVSSEPKLIIPKINVDVPVIYNVTPDHESQMKAMENGVAWFGIPGANSKPGQVGNTVLSGHSSNDVIDQGDYKFIFARLDHLQKEDTLYINYNSKRYAYRVIRKEVVAPTEVNKLIYPTDKPILTLITCTPLGTSLNRLLVTAEQVSPDPSKASKAPSTSTTRPSTAAIPGNSPTFLQRVFGD